MRLSVIFHIDFLDLYIDYTHAHLKDTSKNLYVSEHNVIKYQVFRIHAVRGKFFCSKFSLCAPYRSLKAVCRPHFFEPHCVAMAAKQKGGRIPLKSIVTDTSGLSVFRGVHYIPFLNRGTGHAR